MQFLVLIALFLFLLFPESTYAAPPPSDFKDLLGIFTNIINLIIPIIFALTFIAITWGVIKAWIMGESSSDDVEKGKQIVFIGIIVLVIMSSVWGIVRFLQSGIFGS